MALLAVGLLGLSACSGDTGPDQRLTCWRGPDPKPLDCRYDLLLSGSQLRVTVHHPDGGFRRLLVDPNGTWHGADGADVATQSYDPAVGTSVEIGGWRYLWPKELQRP